MIYCLMAIDINNKLLMFDLIAVGFWLLNVSNLGRVVWTVMKEEQTNKQKSVESSSRLTQMQVTFTIPESCTGTHQVLNPLRTHW